MRVSCVPLGVQPRGFLFALPLLLVLSTVFFLAGCAVTAPPQAVASPAPSATPAAEAAPQPVVDARGKTVALSRPPQRIVSLAASNTEILFALGLGKQVVGVDDFSNYPPEAQEIAKVGALKMSAETILALQPDLVLAAGITNPDLILAIERAGVPVLTIDAQDLPGILETIRIVGKATGRTRQAEELVASLQARIDAVVSKTRQATRRPRVFHEVDASDPAKPFTAGPGSFIDALISLAGGENVAKDAQSPWPQIALEQLVRTDPEVIVIGRFAGQTLTPAEVARRPGWENLTAVKTSAIYFVDADLVSRPGPRIVDALEAYARILHPELFAGETVLPQRDVAA